MEIALRIEGTEQLQRRLRLDGERLGARLEEALRKGSLLIEREAKQRTPVDTGRLRASITTDLFPIYAAVAPHTDYAIYVHEGTQFMQPRPFMAQGLEAAKERIVDIFHTLLKDL